MGREGFEPSKSKQQIYSLSHLATLVSPPIISLKNRADGGIRTPDQLITNQLLWPTELHRLIPQHYILKELQALLNVNFQQNSLKKDCKATIFLLTDKKNVIYLKKSSPNIFEAANLCKCFNLQGLYSFNFFFVFFYLNFKCFYTGINSFFKTLTLFFYK